MIIPPDLNPFDHALELVAQKQYAAAIPFLTEALNATNASGSGSSGVQHQSKLKLYYQRGSCYLAAQKYKQAVEDFTRVITLTPKNAQLFAKRGKAYAHLNQHHAALSDYNEAISISASSNSTAYSGSSASRAELRGLYLARSKVYRGMNNLTNALDDLKRAELTDGHRDAELYYQRAQLYSQRRQDTLALEDQTRFLELQEEVAHQELDADIHSGAGSAGGSGESQDRVQEVRLKRAELLQRLAAEEDAQQCNDVDLSSIEQGELSSPADTSDKNVQSPTGYRSLKAIEFVHRSIEDYTLVLNADPENTEALRLRGEAYGHIGKYDEAFKDFDDALRFEPHEFAVHMSRAKLYQQQNNLKKAIDEITNVLRVNGFFMDALFFRAKLFEQIGDVEKAKRDYTSIIEAHYDLLGDSSNELANEKTPLLSKGSNSTKPCSKSPPTAKPAKIASQYTAQALLFRARLSLQTNTFDAAAADYERILSSYPNHMEAQIELPETFTKKALFEEKAHLDALEWAKEEQVREEEARKQANGGSNSTTSGAKSKKKKKKKKKKRPTQAEYVLLEDEEDDGVFAERGNAQPKPTIPEQHVEEQSVNDDGEQPEDPAESPALSSAISVVVTRDEACESMWEQSDDQTDSEEVNALDEQLNDRHSVMDLRNEAAGGNEEEVTSEVEASQQNEEDEDEDEGDADGEDANGSATDSNSTTTIREVLMDEKYLKKRQKQLEKLRENFLEVCESRDKSGIEQALERAERKQMAESLRDEIRQARAVLDGMEKEAADAIARKTHEQVSPENPAMLQTKKQIYTQIQVSQEDTEESSTAKLPSLVIRPLAYGQALQLAEQSQTQFVQNQRLLQEKDAEIAYLKQLLAQTKRQESIERFDELDDALSSNFASLRSHFPHKDLRDLESRVEVLVDWMGPNDEADLVRRKILAFVHRVLESANFALGTPILFFPTGSFPMKTYLPTADLDVCLLLPKELQQTWYFPVLHSLCLAGSSTQSDGGTMNGSPNPKLSAGLNSSALPGGNASFASNTVRNVTFINADVRVIKCTIDNVSVDLTANRVGALGALLLLDSMDAQVGQGHLLKKSLILIKAWCIHESNAYTSSGSATPHSQTPGAAPSSAGPPSVLGSSHGAFSTYAINTVVMGLFNQYGSKITHPLQALFLFLDRMAEFPWHESAMTLHGPIALNVLAATSSLISVMKKRQQHHASGKQQQHGREKAGRDELYSTKLSVDDVEHIRMNIQDQFGGFDVASSSSNGFKVSMFPIRVCNIVDPLDEKNNLARSVSVDWFPSMKRAFRLGRNRLAQLLLTLGPSSGAERKTSSNKMDEMDDFFANCWKSYGRGDGWRPDLLVHPRQAWHGKPAGGAHGGVLTGDPSENDQRWQSILPEFLPSGQSPYQQPQQGAMYQSPYLAQHQYQQHQYAHHSHHQHLSQRAMIPTLAGTAVASTSEILPFQPQHHHQQHQHHHQRRSFDSKSSPLKSSPSSRQHHSPGGPIPGGAYASGSSSIQGKPSRRFDSPSYALSK